MSIIDAIFDSYASKEVILAFLDNIKPTRDKFTPIGAELLEAPKVIHFLELIVAMRDDNYEAAKVALDNYFGRT